MIVGFDNIANDARIWIFQANRIFSQLELEFLEKSISLFLNSWTAHGSQLSASFKIEYNTFIIIALDEKNSTATGCSIDKLVNYMKQIENEFSVRLLDRLDISYILNDELIIERLDDFKKNILTKKIDKNTIVFNNLIKLKNDLADKWKIPLSNSWHKQLIK
jgi:hypothetical protein|tara:strand:- start:1820 stop:2305 length:486 start_codon:yes stop_codon:yes gene_type:complete